VVVVDMGAVVTVVEVDMEEIDGRDGQQILLVKQEGERDGLLIHLAEVEEIMAHQPRHLVDILVEVLEGTALESAEDQLVEVGVLLYLVSSVKQFRTYNVIQYLVSNVAQSANSNVHLYQDSSVVMFPGNNAKMFLVSNAQLCLNNNVKMFLDKFVPMFQDNNVENSAALLLGVKFVASLCLE